MNFSGWDVEQKHYFVAIHITTRIQEFLQLQDRVNCKNFASNDIINEYNA